MGFEQPLLMFAYQILSVVPSVLVLIGCVVYLMRSRDRLGWVALVGQTGVVLMGLVRSVVFFAQWGGRLSMSRWARISTRLSYVGFVWPFIFAVGFIIIALRAGQRAKLSPVDAGEGRADVP